MKLLRRYNLVWKVLTPLHVGAGVTGTQKSADGHDAELALILRDHAKSPWIPGSTLKGVFRAICPMEQINSLFGCSHTQGASFARGALTIGAARLEGKAGGRTIFQLSQTSIDSGTGTAKANKLYTREFVLEGTTFVSEIELELRGADLVRRMKESSADLEQLLARAKSERGLQVGANGADDFGRLRLESVTCDEAQFDACGWSGFRPLGEVDINIASETTDSLLSIHLSCPGPFISRGALDDNKTLPLLDRKGEKPRINGTAVSGALRKQAEWLWALHIHRGGAPNHVMRNTSAGPRKLDPVQRLFGYEGRRGLLTTTIAPRKVSAEGRCEVPGVSLDAMTNAPRDGLLFSYDAHHGVSFELLITTRAALDPTESKLFTALRADIEHNGLKLGMGTTKGFGWFMPSCSHYHHHISEKRAIPLKRMGVRPNPVSRDLPAPEVTIPYRLSRVDPTNITFPEDQVAKAFSERELLSRPMNGAASGYIDLVWHIETPVLVARQSYAFDNWPDATAFQKVGERYVIPGSTLKGMLRAELERRFNARAYRIFDHLARTVSKNGIDSVHLDHVALQREFAAHLVACNEDYAPDLVEALFGFVREPEDDKKSGAVLHAARHLKSRISFGLGWLVSDHDEEKSQNAKYPIAAAEPNLKSKFYDHIGRKAYLVEPIHASTVEKRLAKAHFDPGKYSSNMKFLHPVEGQNLLFAQRLYFHNVTEAEIGAFLEVLMLGYDLAGRFMIGRARAFGAGRCFPALVDINLTPNAGGDYPVHDPASNLDKRMIGRSAAPFQAAYVAFSTTTAARMRANVNAKAEFFAAHSPKVGFDIREHARDERGKLLDLDKVYYQQTTDNPRNRSFPREKREAAKGANNGRLAAMLSKKW